MDYLFHHTSIRLHNPKSEWYWDEQLQDKVWKRIFFYLITKDISMRWDWDPYVMSSMILELPPPDPNNFRPFDAVEERCVLGWIDSLMKDEMLAAQEKNTMMLQVKIAGGHHEDDISAWEDRDYLKRKQADSVSGS